MAAYQVAMYIHNGIFLQIISAGAEGFTPESDQEIVRKIEKQLKNRFPIGSQVHT